MQSLEQLMYCFLLLWVADLLKCKGLQMLARLMQGLQMLARLMQGLQAHATVGQPQWVDTARTAMM